MQSITGIVTQGKGIGSQFGFPTANIFCDNDTLNEGTRRYNVIIENNNKVYKGLGPYFPHQQLLEVHLLNFQGDLYGKKLTIYPLGKIRDNQKFYHTTDLIKQITEDKKYVDTHSIKVMTFGTFDLFHPGHQSYLSQAKQRGDILITVVARDETTHSIKGHSPQEDEYSRLKHVQDFSSVDDAVLGDTHDHYRVIKEKKPHIIALGYDQHSFEDYIGQYCEHHHIREPLIIRLSPYHPEKFKSSLLR